MPFYLLISAILLFIFPNVLLGETIILRDKLPSLHGEILVGGPSGLLFRQDGNSVTSIRIPWSSIRTIEPEETRIQINQFLKDGEKLWRAKQRLLRGDLQLSEPIFTTQFKKLLGIDSDDARLASEGLLRALIARGAIERAIHPWFETVRLNEAGFKSPFPELEPIIDSQTMLCPHLPIIQFEYISSKILNTYISDTCPITSALATIFIENNNSLQPPKTDSPIEDSLFLQQLLGSISGNTQFADDLRSRLEELRPWQKAWAHYAIATGLLRSSSVESRKLGMLHLAQVAAMNPEIQPWLIAAAMLTLSKELTADGFEQQAERIQFEALRLFPSHPLVSDFIDKKRNKTQ